MYQVMYVHSWNQAVNVFSIDCEFYKTTQFRAMANISNNVGANICNGYNV